MQPWHEVTPRWPQLAENIRQARRAPFYRDRLSSLDPFPHGCKRVGNEEVWGRIPLTTKADLRAAYPQGLLAVPANEIASYHESTGTSGEPTATFLTSADWDGIVARFLRNGAKLTADDWVLVKAPYAMVTTAHQVDRAARSVGATVVPASNRSHNISYPKVIRLLRDLPISVVWCMPTEATLWLKAAKLAGLDPRHSFPHLRAFIVAGEGLSASRAQALSAAWGGVRFFRDYGSTETGSLAGDCEAGRLHLWQDHFHFELDEIIDGDDFSDIGPAAAGDAMVGSRRGNLVVTTLTRAGSPLVRYDLGDEVALAPSCCPCGSTSALIHVFGRRGGEVVIGGRRLFATDIEQALFATLPIGEMVWRGLHSDEELLIEVDQAVSPGDELRLADQLQVPVKLTTNRSLVDPGLLTRPSSFRKPQYLFQNGQDWNAALIY